MILILLHQDPDIAREAGVFLRFLIPGLFAYSFLQNVLRFLQAQSIVMPLAFCSVGSLVIHIGIAYALVHWTDLGFKGAPLAASISIWISFLTLCLYVFFSKRFSHIWRDGLSFEPVHHILTNLKLALPSAAMLCLEEWAFELLVLLAGLMPNSGTTTSVVAMCTRVANELGAGNPAKAKHAMFVTLKLSVVLAIAVDLALLFGHNVWASLFGDNAEIIKEFDSMTPFLLISFMFDFIQGIVSGVTRGCGWQHLAMCINLATFYFIGMPIAGLLAFKFNLNSQGLWLGLICGLACQSTGLLLLTLMTR
ncbi:MATE efflux family protein LAL5 [Capsicum annuum]|nr:MATE efflux family protein LAL5 [Capsicum annuum]